MRRMTARRMVVSGLVLAIALAARPARSAEKAPNERLLPPRTYAYVTVPSVGELKTRFDKSLTGRLLKDPKLADFLGDVHKKFAEFAEEFQKHVGVKIDDVLAVPDGEFSLAVLLPTDAKKLAVAGILDFGKSGSTVTTLLDKAAAGLEKSGFKKSTHDCEGSRMIVFTKAKPVEKDKDKEESSSADKNEEPAFGSQFAYVVKDESLVVSTSQIAMHDILKRWDGKHSETLAEVPAYKAITELSKQHNGVPIAVWYLDPVTLVKSFLASSDSVDPGVSMALGFLPVLGLNNLKGLGGSFHLAGEDFDSESRTLICVDQPTSGLLNVFQFPPVSQSPPKWVTDDATSFVSINWDIAKAYTAIEGLADNLLGPGGTAQKLDDWATEENGPKIHLKKDVIDNLDGVIQISTDSPDPNKPETTRILVAVGVKDSKKAKSVLDKVSKMPGFPGQARDFRGEVIYNLEGLPGFGNGSTTAGAAVVNNNLMISNDVGRIEQVIIADKDRKPLAESEKYRKIAKNFPAKTSVAWYQEQDTQMKAIYEMFRSGKAPEAIANTQFGKIIEGIDFKKLPDFEVIRKYLPASGTYAVPHPSGALIQSFTLKTATK